MTPSRRLLTAASGAALLVCAAPAGAQSLDELLVAALEHSPSVAGADARAQAAAANRDFAQRQRLPDLTAQGQIGTGRIDPQGFFGLTADDVTPRSAQVTAEIPLLTFGRIGGGIGQAAGGAEAARLSAMQTRLNLKVDVTRAYSGAVAAQRLSASYDLLSRSLAELVRQSELKFQVGDATSTEIAQAKARLAEAEANRAAAQGTLRANLAALRSLTGLDAVEPEGALPPAPPVPQTQDAAIALASAGNPSLLAASQSVAAAEGKLKAARAESLPAVSAYAEAASVRDQFFPGYAADSASVGVRFKWNFFSSGRNEARTRAAGSERDAAEADYAAAQLETERAATVAFDGYQTARLVLSAAEARDAAAREALRGTRLEVEAGAKPQLALLDAEREAIAAEAALAAAQGQVLVAAYALQAVTGGAV